MLSPMRQSAVGSAPVSMASRRPPPPSRTATTVPTAVTMPVNMASVPRPQAQQQVAADVLALHDRELQAPGQGASAPPGPRAGATRARAASARGTGAARRRDPRKAARRRGPRRTRPAASLTCRAASAANAAFRSTPPADEPTARTSAPAARSAAARTDSSSEHRIRAWPGGARMRATGGVRSFESSTTRSGWRTVPGRRTSSRGSSAMHRAAARQDRGGARAQPLHVVAGGRRP